MILYAMNFFRKVNGYTVMWNLITWPFRIFSSILGALIGIILFFLWAWCVYDCITRRFRDPSHKGIWLAVLILSMFIGAGPIAAFIYMMFGRQQSLRF